MRAILITCVALFATSVNAETSFYTGAGAGVAKFANGTGLSDATNVPQFDNQELGFKLFVGYELTNNWALEFGYIDFGNVKSDFYNADDDIDYAIDYSSQGVYLNGQYHLPIAERFSLDLGIGWLFAEADADLSAADGTSGNILDRGSFSFDDSGLNLGLAITWRTTDSLYLRGTIDGYAVDFDNTIRNPWRLGVDLIWDF